MKKSSLRSQKIAALPSFDRTSCDAERPEQGVTVDFASNIYEDTTEMTPKHGDSVEGGKREFTRAGEEEYYLIFGTQHYCIIRSERETRRG